MAFVLSRLINTGPGQWRYKTADADTVVRVAGYFNMKGSPLKLGDVIERLTVSNIDAANEAVVSIGRHVVNSVAITAGVHVIDVTDQEAGEVTDSD